jgi:hypothetical protein
MDNYSRDQYKKAYNILMDYWVYLPDEEKKKIDIILQGIFRTGNVGGPNQETISRALERLKKNHGYGVK